MLENVGLGVRFTIDDACQHPCNRCRVVERAAGVDPDIEQVGSHPSAYLIGKARTDSPYPFCMCDLRLNGIRLYFGEKHRHLI